MPSIPDVNVDRTTRWPTGSATCERISCSVGRPEALARHAALLFADQLGSRSPRDYLTRALTEIERSQLND
jgi:hypothetical protein